MPRKKKPFEMPPNAPLFEEIRRQNPNLRRCEIPGCPYIGEHKAPYSKDELRRFRWFCLAHVRDYNASWDYFSDMKPEQIEDFMKDAMFGHRPTWKINQQKLTEEHLEDALHAMLHGAKRGTREERKKRAQKRQQSEEEQKALAVLDLEGEATLQEIKKQYKLLVKKYHPDVNSGDKKLEDRFKCINQAYRDLQKLRAHPRKKAE